MKRGDRVEIRKGVHQGSMGTVTEVTSGGKRVGVRPDGQSQPYSLAVGSVRVAAGQ